MTADLTPISQQILHRRYLAKNPQGEVVEAPQEMFSRVAHNIAQADRNYGATDEEVDAIEREFCDLMSDLYFIPNSPTLMNAGRELQMLSGCFVLPVGDSMEEIFDSIKAAAMVHKSGGGTGFSFSRLRPEGYRVGSTGGIASGPVSFMKVFNAATEAVKQGSTRRGANMGILRVDHPDIMKFISAKRNPGEMENFNLSVAVTEDFMKAALEDRPYDLIDPMTNEAVGAQSAREVFDHITDQAWRHGDPGIVFLDRINDGNPNSHIGEIEATNPCGEQPLMPYESCNLGSINLSLMVKYGTGGRAEIDWIRLSRTCRSAVHFLDNVIDMNRFPLQQITDMTQFTRRIGLGVMGWADALIQMGIRYDSDGGLGLADDVASFIQHEAHSASMELAHSKGSYPGHPGSLYDRNLTAMRNTAPVTIAPTGTISMIAGCSSGIEPLYNVAFVRNQAGMEMTEMNSQLEGMLRGEGWDEHDLTRLKDGLLDGGTLQNGSGVPSQIRDLFRTAHDIGPWWHVQMQAVWQRHVDNAVSKTINFPSTATVDDVREAYLQAYETGCKGITVYRDGSRRGQVLSAVRSDKSPEKLAHVCPECSTPVIYEEGCVKCASCGWGWCDV